MDGLWMLCAGMRYDATMKQSQSVAAGPAKMLANPNTGLLLVDATKAGLAAT